MDLRKAKIEVNNDLEQLLKGLIKSWEYEVVEFKEANNDYDKNRIGQYFSALSNEANLRNLQYGWLIFGVRNRDKKIVGTNYRVKGGLDKLKHEIAQNVTGGMSFIDIHEIYPVIEGEEKRVIMFQIPAAITAIPTGWNNYEYGRDGESLVALSQEKRERIRRQEKLDWSKRIIPEAKMNHLDKGAIKLARQKYQEKISDENVTKELEMMTDEEFLERRKLIINGQITNAAMLLLGNAEHDYLFSTVPEASWRIFDNRENLKDYKILKIPFLTLSDRILGYIRNLTYRYMPDQLTLFPTETKQYDPWVLRELLNNCIAHTDYSIGGRIYVNEFEDKLIFKNPGTFIPGSVEPILSPSYTAPFYRNQLLAESMVMFKMIDTEATGIRRSFRVQQDKLFPLPDYDLSVKEEVSVRIYGKEIDERFTHLLFKNRDLDLRTVYLLDQVQKGRPIDKDSVKQLRRESLIEGRVGSLYLASPLAHTAEEKARYIKNRAFDDKYYQDMIVDYISEFGKANKQAVRNLLWDKLPDTLEDKQKERKILTLLTALKRKGVIKTDSPNKQKSNWILADEQHKLG